MTNEEKAIEIVDSYKSFYKDIAYLMWSDMEDTVIEMAKWKDKQFVKELRKVLEFSASPVDMKDEINNLIQKYENQ